MIEKTETQTQEDRLSSRRLRLQTLVRLRWLAVTGQAVTVAIVAFLLKFPLPLVASCSLIAALAGVNFYLMIRYPATAFFVMTARGLRKSASTSTHRRVSWRRRSMG